ncbi:MAG: MBOAT family protein [Clostridia bacterium]|nr:MBOAT family protein [Clostridia bacterium]
MLFNSFAFAIFLPIVFILYWICPKKYQWIILLSASCYFYMSWNVKYILLIFTTTIVTYLCALLIEKHRNKKKVLLTVSLLVCLGLLFFFKYFNFAVESIHSVLSLFSLPIHPFTLKVMLPVGISFYTFQTLSYVIDVYKGDIVAEKHFGIYATFVTFFPQLVAGPIERTNHLLPEVKKTHYLNGDNVLDGLKIMLWGFFKKLVVADNLAIYVDTVYNDISNKKGFALALATVFFAFQIYCDFSGYSDIARGTAKLLDIRLMQNFKSPYCASTIKEFWSRWHISLSTWFRDYVYIPLGGNRVSKPRHYFNLLVTFLVSGLWHGANWTFVVWGALHGIAQMMEDIFKIKAPKNRKIWWLLRVLLVFSIVCFAWVFFRAQTLSDALSVFKNMFVGIGNPLQYINAAFETLEISKLRIIFMIAVYFLPLIFYDFQGARYGKEFNEVLADKRPALQWGFYFIIGLFTILFSQKGVAAEFVYFQF